MYQIPELTRLHGLKHAFSTVEDGNLALNYGDQVIVQQSRRHFLASLSIPAEQVILMGAVHGTTILSVGAKQAGQGIAYGEPLAADGLITNSSNVYLWLGVADCLPIIIYDPKTPAIGLIHAGWRGIDQHIAGIAVDRLAETYGSQAADLIIVIGPHIHTASYCVERPRQADQAAWQPYLHRQANQTCLDLAAYTVDQLLGAGVKQENISVSPIDTATDRRFFSHRRSQQTGEPEARFACLVSLSN